MDKKKNKGAFFLRLLGILFILYISLTIAIQTGYYEAKLSEKTTITNEAIKQFESDVRDGKNVDINDYLTDTYKDYSNQTTKTGFALSSLVEEFMSKGIKEMVNVFKMLFT